MSLKRRLKAHLKQFGPMSIPDYMAICLFDKEDGYYSQHVKLGDHGDFITAPHVSQMFGEVIAAFLVEAWVALGEPKPFLLIEMGAGDATLFADMLNLYARLPEFLEAAQFVIIEPSERLRALQADKLKDIQLQFYDHFQEVPEHLPFILYGNEVLDCLGARQYVRHNQAWHERLVGLNDQDELCFGIDSMPSDFQGPIDAPNGYLFEKGLAQAGLIAPIAERMKHTPGLALFIDYGRDHCEPGDTLQALYAHEKREALEAPGIHDLTQWVDFPLLIESVQNQGLGVQALVNQGEFLQQLGIQQRYEALLKANPDRADILNRQIHRLLSPDEMGQLFKVFCFHSPDLSELPGFSQ